jgi:uncharacterized protein (TIGR02145 family)
VLLLFILPVLHACKKETKPEPLTVTDYDGNVYKTIKIGKQIWMAENLKTTHYRNGDPIDNGNGVNYDWSNKKAGAYCDYDRNADNANPYGHLYNWYAVANASKSTPQYLAPEGWHIPTKEEFETLKAYVSKNNTLTPVEISNAMREKGTAHWTAPNDNATNSSGFKALGSGYRLGTDTFENLKTSCCFWSSTLDASTNAAFRYYIATTNISIDTTQKQYGFSIRCIKD